jgi:hypothetical protein
VHRFRIDADPPQQAAHGLYFILGQARLAAAVRLSQTLGLGALAFPRVSK